MPGVGKVFLVEMFERRIEGVGPVVVRPVVDWDTVADVEVRCGPFPVGGLSPSIVTVEDFFGGFS